MEQVLEIDAAGHQPSTAAQAVGSPGSPDDGLLDAYSRATVGLIRSAACSVVQIEPDSPARQAGLHEGDIIIGFGGIPVPGIDDLHRLLTHDVAESSMPIRLIRGTETITLFVIPVEAKKA